MGIVKVEAVGPGARRGEMGSPWLHPFSSYTGVYRRRPRKSKINELEAQGLHGV